ncbi:TIGR03915 family putative DNA repair protein [Sulfurospirillum diekertiae]|uniref:TIGR03915 family putative DNA repair protein n=1 Tax=Sulfurospirillum diekertiae TaxID=1854492 RepID=A0A6G9VVC8_9BACT|nr:TIGR03915 family putative DNA repair protein [Sulfurospirillum diekertiae]QIR77351.1 TIGR03915 family putative DNA repair protein [Sulfurospirillum diekertiae]QIR79969.1 TIGR03915 family putative DNA repair protein [Sulfurospirillum diekertiae]
MILLYDGSFEGYLSLVYEVYYEKLEVSTIVKKMPETLLFERFHEVFTDEIKAHKVLDAMTRHFTKEQQRTIFHSVLCDTRDYEMALLEYIRIGFKNPKELRNITNASLFYIQNLEKELLCLVHKMYGFTRFEELEDGTLYAKIETKFNIVPFLGDHFCKRLGNIPFIIHDVKRALAFVKNDELREIRSIATFDTPTYSSEEEKFKSLWKVFFKSAAVESRYNPKLQKSWVPLLYRTYMSEFNITNAT